ncbi:MAG: Asp-tRNA(Asn)/Glu-tRNA(Gln) amidotransferase subunit GatC [Paracoccaceae bacterium]
MSVDKDTVRRVAHLARIAVAEEELEPLAKRLNAILDFAGELAEVNVDGVEPMTSVTPMLLKRRADIVTDGEIQDKILANAPDARQGFFSVPKVVE